MPITAEYDREADALYVRLSDGARARAIEVSETTYVDIDTDGRPVGIELLYPSMGIVLDEVLDRFALHPQRPAIVGAITQSGAPVETPTYTGGTHMVSTTVMMLAIEGTVAAAHGVALTGTTKAPEP